MSTLLLVRHGETAMNSNLRYWGRTDVELGKLGLKQAESLRDMLATRKIDTIFASERQRALETARIIASEHEANVTIRPELNEVNFGDIEGMTFEEVSRRYPDVAKAWIKGGLDFRYPGGESLAELGERAIRFACRLNDLAPEATALIVAHSGILRLLMCHLIDIGQENWWRFHLDFASLSIMETNNRGAIFRLLNSTSHLEEEAQTGQ